MANFYFRNSGDAYREHRRVIQSFVDGILMDANGYKDFRCQISNTFGNCASGSAAAPTTVATIAIRAWLMQRLLRIWLAIHSRILVSTPLAFIGAQLSISVSGDSATVRGGTARPDADAA